METKEARAGQIVSLTSALGRPLRALAISLAVAVATGGCVHDRIVTAGELRDWYAETAGTNDPFYNGLHYLGSDGIYHYFMFRMMDSWFFPRVPQGEVELPDLRPYRSNCDAPVYGYYPIDPLNGWEPIRGEQR